MSYNKNNAGVRRLMREAIEMKEATDLYHAQPIDDDNLFEWHFTVRGPPDTEFEQGIYHGRISFPPEYPMKPPSIFMLTKNGRFEVNKKICLSISGYHPETWLPSWSVRTALLAIIGFMPSKAEGAVGSLDYTPEERTNLAKFSLYFKCPKCGIHCGDILKQREQLTSSSSASTHKDLELAKSLAQKSFTQTATSSTVDIKERGGDEEKGTTAVRKHSDAFRRDSAEACPVVSSGRDNLSAESQQSSEVPQIPQTSPSSTLNASDSSSVRLRTAETICLTNISNGTSAAASEIHQRVTDYPKTQPERSRPPTQSSRQTRVAVQRARQETDVTQLGLIIIALIILLAIISLLLRRLLSEYPEILKAIGLDKTL